MQHLSAYLDYRQFLRDQFAEQKARNPRYSQRVFARKAGLTSMGFYSEVLNGKRQLAPAAVLRFAKALKLTAPEQAYFEALVAFNQAKTVEERNHHFAKLAGQRGARADVVGSERYAFYSRWYHAALRELIAVRPTRASTRDDFARLGQTLEPPVPAAKVRQAIDLLLRLGFVVRGGNGILKQAAPVITTGALGKVAPTTLDVDNFQAATLDLARKALDRQPRGQRDFSTLTLSLSAEGEEAAHAEIAALRKRLLALAEKDARADRVRQFNFQSFALSRP
jgi:uncharacterized protein (TIGR02147 family)